MHRTLKAHRAMKGYNQNDMAKILRISVTSYNKKENGRIEFTLNEAKILADYFGVSIEGLFFSDKVPEIGTNIPDIGSDKEGRK